MQVKNILAGKPIKVFCTEKNVPSCVAFKKMLENNVGVLPVMEDDKLVGIISERDALKICISTIDGNVQHKVSDLMTSGPLFTCSPEDHIESLMSTMTNKKIRHIPVIEDDKVIGIVSIGDLIKALLDAATNETTLLKEYIQGSYPA